MYTSYTKQPINENSSKKSKKGHKKGKKCQQDEEFFEYESLNENEKGKPKN